MRLAACLYVRNEAPDIAEWLAFHHGVGFDHVLVFDNLSTDATSAVVRQAARHASITLLPWPVRDKRAQLLAYALGRRLLRRFDRVAFLDSDEFLTPTGERGVKAVLETLADADAIAVNWAVFGSNGHADAPPGLVIERFTRRAEDAFPANRIVKSIVDPRRVRRLNVHVFDVRGGSYLRPNGSPVVWDGDARTAEPPAYAALQVCHFLTRSKAHWTRKIARGYRDIERPSSLFDYYDRNEREDLSAARFAGPVRAELSRRGQGPRALGSKTIGGAVGDLTGAFASPLALIRRRKFTEEAGELVAHMQGRGAGGIVIGLPLNMDGTEGPRCQSARAFARNLLRLRPELAIAFWDERLSTVAVERPQKREAHRSPANPAEAVGRAAGAVLLQGALDRLRSARPR